MNAGVDQIITLPASANLAGTVTDDGLPGPYTVAWSKVSGPGTVTFGTPSAVNTTATFSLGGVYTLRLTANDGALTAFDDMVVTVNQAPTVNAGPDQTITLPASANLSGSVTDDGLPAAFTVSWSKVSGPGTVTFGNPSAVTTTASFSAAGSYTLRLTANDGVASAFDDIVVTVNSSGGSATIVEQRIALSSDDAEEKAGVLDYSSGRFDLGYDGTVPQTDGLRFAMAIPQGAAIVNAWVQFMVDSADSSACSLTFQGQAADNTVTFKTSSNITSWPRTAASVNWTPPAWTVVGQAGAAQRTPNLAPIVQEIVSRPGWVSGNSLVLIITGTGHRAAETFTGNQPAGAALLHVEYQ